MTDTLSTTDEFGMTERNLGQPAVPSLQPRFLPLLLILFVGSGCSALIYEIVWLQLLQLVIGSSAVSLAVLLGTFMGGMCLGSITLPRIVSRRRHPLRVYALLELGTGIAGIAVLFAVPYVNQVYVANVVPGLAGILVRLGLGGLPAAAHLAHGRNLAGDCPMGRGHATRRIVVRVLLWREHRRGRLRLPGRGVLLAESPRHHHGHVCRRGDQRGRIADRAGARIRDSLPRPLS